MPFRQRQIEVGVTGSPVRGSLIWAASSESQIGYWAGNVIAAERSPRLGEQRSDVGERGIDQRFAVFARRANFLLCSPGSARLR